MRYLVIHLVYSSVLLFDYFLLLNFTLKIKNGSLLVHALFIINASLFTNKKRDPHFLKNLDIGIDECSEFNPFKDGKNATNIPLSNLPDGFYHIEKNPTIISLESLYDNEQNIKREVENVAQCRYC